MWPPATRDEHRGRDLHHDLVDRSTWVASNFVMALDGAIAVDRTSRKLGGDGDRQVFRSLRDHADVVMAGAGTVRAESYGPTRRRAGPARGARGQQDRPRLVVVTRSADLEGLDRLWSDPGAPISVLTGTDSPDDAVAWVRERAEVIAVGDHGPDLRAGLAMLAGRGEGRVLAEGGPSLQADLLELGLLTDVFTTLAPVIVGGGRTSVPRTLPTLTHLDLATVWRHGDEVFLHHQVRAGA